ncbi:MAG: hypothetical protein QG593_647, partial [Patescibacteria group bacterium]|nr:hypothetical protein [Patescibacteria group bacterium]
VIAMLYPLGTDEDKFGDAFDVFFGGHKMTAKRRALYQVFASMTRHEIPSILPELVRDYLIPRFTNYCNQHVQSLKASANETQDEAFIVNNMAAMLGVTITCHTPDRVAGAGMICEAYPKEGQGLHVLKHDSGWLPLVNLSNNLSLKESSSHIQPTSPYCPAFEGMVQSGMQVTLDSLRKVSISRSQQQPFLTSRTIIYSGEGTPSSGMHNLVVRYNNLDTITVAIKEDVTRVNLSAGQNRPEPWENAELMGAGVGALIGVGTAGAIELGLELGFGLIAGAMLYIEAVPLAVLITLVGLGVGVEGKRASQQYCQALVAATGHLNNKAYLEAASVLDEQFAAWALTQWVRSGFLSYEHQAVAHLYRAICEEAIEANVTRYSGSGYTADRAIAYKHYTQAAIYAKSANREFLHFISDLCRLKLLKKSTPEQLGFKAKEGNENGGQIALKEEFDKTLKSLTQNYNGGFLDLYSKLNHNMLNLMQVFSSGHPIAPEAVIAANTFLKFDDFYMLEHVNKGRGAFIDVLGLCVQAALLAKLHQTHPEAGLEIKTKSQLIRKFHECKPEDKDFNLAMASEIFREAAKLLSALKIQYAEEITVDKDLETGLVCIEDFMLRFHAHCHDRGEFFENAYQELIGLLAIPEARANKILVLAQYTTKLLNDIEKNFGYRLLSLKDWLNELIKPNNELKDKIDPNSGDSMLHYLSQMPFTGDESTRAMVVTVARLLKYQMYVRNHANETPLFVLKTTDVYGIAVEIFSEPEPGDSLKPFGSAVMTALPNAEHRKKLLQHQFREKRISDENIEKITSSMTGFSSAELEEAVLDIAPNFVDIDDELVTQVVDYCQKKKKPWSSILEDIKQVIWNDCDRYISSKSSYAGSLDSYLSQKSSQKTIYKNNVQESLDILFSDPEFQKLILEYYNLVQEVAIPKLRRKAEYLTSLVALKRQDETKFQALKEFCKAVKTEAIQNMESKFAQLIESYIRNAWVFAFPKPIRVNSNAVFFRATGAAAIENAAQQKMDIIDTKMKIFKTFFVHYLDKTYTLFAVLTKEAVNRKRDDVLSSLSSMIKSTDVKVGVGIPFLGNVDANISQVIGGIIDLFQMANEFLDKQKMQMLCNCFPEDETQRFDAVTSAALKLSVELSPELYHMPDEAIRNLAELVVTRIVSYIKKSESNVHEAYPNFVQRTFAGVQSMFAVSITSHHAKHKDLITICRDGMRSPRGNAETCKVSKQVSPNKKDSPTYQEILDSYGKIIVQENGEIIGFVKPKRGQAYCMAQPCCDKSLPQTDTNLPERLQDILSTSAAVYSCEMNNNNTIIADNIFHHRRQQSWEQKLVT